MALVGKGFYNSEVEFWKLGWLIKGAQRAGLGWDTALDTPEGNLEIKLLLKQNSIKSLVKSISPLSESCCLWLLAV